MYTHTNTRTHTENVLTHTNSSAPCANTRGGRRGGVGGRRKESSCACGMNVLENAHVYTMLYSCIQSESARERESFCACSRNVYVHVCVGGCIERVSLSLSSYACGRNVHSYVYHSTCTISIYIFGFYTSVFLMPTYQFFAHM